MKKQRQKKLFSAVTAVFLAFTLAFGIMPAPAFAVTQAEIDELERKKEAIEEKVEEKQAVVDELEEQHASVLDQKKALDERNDYLYEQLNINAEQIALYNELIAQKAREVDAAKAKELEQLERYRRRVRAMEENGNADYLAMLLNANSLGEFLTAIDDIGEIMESDKLLEDAYIAARENTERVKADYEAYKAELELKKEELNAEKVRIESEIAEAARLIEEIRENIDTHAEELEELLQAQKDAEELIEKKIAELEEQKRREEEERQRREEEERRRGEESSGGGSSGGEVLASGNFAWPCGCTYITSRVGGRIHPISGVYKYHSGMDIGCQYGDAVFASDGGTVVLAGENGGYGNCIMIDHGFVNGDHYYTLYGHLSSIDVSYGQTVSQGDYIGAVGSTGVSTGPHLHFEIRNSAGPTDFNWRFESFLTYAPDA
ncbi:MAG: peptidoglycan DD-metalloendopeptidase family protein [Oscillospiraceae bacterium]|nr:peptidoglycan DD-metalloendopeptidase family protein [Oscillospiraceae bacterium]